MSVPLTIIIGDERGLTSGRVCQVAPGPLDVPEGCFVAGIEWKAWGCEPFEKEISQSKVSESEKSS